MSWFGMQCIAMQIKSWLHNVTTPCSALHIFHSWYKVMLKYLEKGKRCTLLTVKRHGLRLRHICKYMHKEWEQITQFNQRTNERTNEPTNESTRTNKCIRNGATMYLAHDNDDYCLLTKSLYVCVNVNANQSHHAEHLSHIQIAEHTLTGITCKCK